MPTDRVGGNVTEEGRPNVAPEPAVLSCLVCAVTGDAITVDGTAYTVRVIQSARTGDTTLVLEKN